MPTQQFGETRASVAIGTSFLLKVLEYRYDNTGTVFCPNTLHGLASVVEM